MTFCKVHDMDVVANTAAVGCGPVVAKYLKFLAAPYSDLTHKGEQVVGNAARVFTDLAAAMGTHRVEIPQSSNAPTGLACRQVHQHLFYSCFAMAVGVDWLHHSRLWDRDLLRVAVKRCTAAENDRPTAMPLHGLQQAAAAYNIHIPIKKWLLDRFAHSLEASEMHHRFNVLVVIAEGTI